MDQARKTSWNILLRMVLLLAAAPVALAQPAGAPAPGGDGGSERMDASLAPLLGREVLDKDGHSAGRVSDVLVDATGQVRAVVLDLGGFMGLGQRRVPVAWAALRVTPGQITMSLSVEAVAALPEYRPGHPALAAAPPR